MPAAYAHYRFGQQMLSVLPPAIQKIARAHPQLYDAGLHGPDPLFFHNISRSDQVHELASRFHHIPGDALFDGFCARLRRPEDPRETAYLFGLLTHYALDSQCHPYIVELDSVGTCPHSQLETEFDRFLLALDGEPLPHTRDLGAHLRPEPEELEIMARFFPPLTRAQMGRCMRNMTWVTKTLSANGLFSRSILERAVPRLGETVRHQFMPRQPDPRAAAYDQPLLALYQEALNRFPSLARQLEDHLYRGTPLGADFAPIMG